MIFTRELLWAIRRDVTFACGRRYTIEVGTRYCSEIDDTTPNMLVWNDNADLDDMWRLQELLNINVWASQDRHSGFLALDCYLYTTGQNSSLAGNCYVCIDPDGKVVLATTDHNYDRRLIGIMAAYKADKAAQARAVELRRVAKLDPGTPLFVVADKLAEEGDDKLATEVRALAERHGEELFQNLGN